MIITSNRLITEQTGKLPSFERAFQIFLAFRCDGSCNDNSDCCHLFTWACPHCGQKDVTNGANMMNVKNFRKGNCGSCFRRRDAAAASGELSAGQIARQDAVDNAIFSLVNELVPEPYRHRVGSKFGDGHFDWNSSWISEVSGKVEDVLKNLLKIESEEESEFEMQFYPYLLPED